MDTDSFFLWIKTDDLWNDIKSDPIMASYFDFSNAPKDHPMYNPNNNELGKFKNEMIVEKKVIIDGVKQKVKYWSEMSEIVFIKPKVYSFKSEYLDKMTIKGTSKIAKEHDVIHQDFVYCVEANHKNYVNYCNDEKYIKINDLNKYTVQHRLCTNKLNMYVYEYNKLTLSNVDDKLWIDPRDGISV